MCVCVERIPHGILTGNTLFPWNDRWFSRNNSVCQDVTVSPQIRILFCYLLSADRCTIVCGALTGILYLHTRKDYTSSSFVFHFVICQSPVGLGISVSVLSSGRLLSVSLSIVSFISHRPSHCITKQGVRTFVFIFAVSSTPEDLYESCSRSGRGESDWTDWITLRHAFASSTLDYVPTHRS